MRTGATTVLTAILALLLTGFADAMDLSTPEMNAQAQFDLLKQKDWKQLAEAMDRDELMAFKQSFLPVVNDPDYPPAHDMRVGLLGVETPQEAIDLSPRDFYAAFLSHVLADNPQYVAAVSGTVVILGHVTEGTNLAHVVIRQNFTSDGIQMSQMDIMSMRKTGDQWLGLMRKDVSALARTLASGIADYKKKHAKSH